MCFKAFLEKQIRIVKINSGNNIYNDLELHRNSLSSKNSKVERTKYQYKVRGRNF